jgi:hypothetical protein
MSETERPGAPGDEEHEASDELNPSPDDDLDEGGGLGLDDPEVEGPDVDELDEDPAYDPDDPGLKGIKGG